MEKAMKRDKIEVNDRQLACAHINSPEGQDYLKSMAAAANFAWVNRSCMTFCARQVFFCWKNYENCVILPEKLNFWWKWGNFGYFYPKMTGRKTFFKLDLNVSSTTFIRHLPKCSKPPPTTSICSWFTMFHTTLPNLKNIWLMGGKKLCVCTEKVPPGPFRPITRWFRWIIRCFLRENREFSIIWFIMHLKHQFLVDRTTGSDRRHDGHM